MRFLSFLHRWAGGLIGLLLALISLSGAILVWEGSWVMLPGAADPAAEQPERIAAIVEAAAAKGGLSRITFAGDEIGLHQAVNEDGSGAYIRQDGDYRRPLGEPVGAAGTVAVRFPPSSLCRPHRRDCDRDRRDRGPVVRHHRSNPVVGDGRDSGRRSFPSGSPRARSSGITATSAC